MGLIESVAVLSVDKSIDPTEPKQRQAAYFLENDYEE
jgi:hypothetical protein